MGINKGTMTMKKTYVDYDYEAEYQKQIENLSEYEFQRLLKEQKVPYLYKTKKTTSGRMVELEIYPVFEHKSNIPRDRIRKTRNAQRNLNDKNARKMFVRLLCTNFCNGDYFGTFNYEVHPASIEEAEKLVINYIRRLNHRRKKLGLPNTKYLIITEQSKNGRIHHHIIMDNLLDRDTVEDLWKHGKRNHLRRLAEDDFGLTGLATYLSKDPKGRKRWKGSRNLKKPKQTVSFSKYKKRRVLRMVRNQNMIETEMAKDFPKNKFLDAEVRHNGINGLFYIYVRMVKKE